LLKDHLRSIRAPTGKGAYESEASHGLRLRKGQPMNRNKILFVIIGAVSLVAVIVTVQRRAFDRPKMLAGQVFVATRGGQNIKMGLVEVRVLPREQVDLAVKKLQTERSEIEQMTAIYPQDADFGAKLKARTQFLETAFPYFAALPQPIIATKTDADGNFLLEIPRDRQCVLAAMAERYVGDATESYFWLLHIDPSTPSRLLLSNDNVISEGDPRSVLQVSCKKMDFSEEIVSAEQLRADYESLLSRQKNNSTASKVRIAGPEGSLPKNVTLTEPVEVRDPASFIVLKFIRGRTFPLLASTADYVTVSYRDHELVIPISSTDLK
jgi:hypothetical protein